MDSEAGVAELDLTPPLRELHQLIPKRFSHNLQRTSIAVPEWEHDLCQDDDNAISFKQHLQRYLLEVKLFDTSFILSEQYCIFPWKTEFLMIFLCTVSAAETLDKMTLLITVSFGGKV